MGTTTEELKKLYSKLGGTDSNIPKASTPGEVLNGINELDLGGGSNVIPNPEGEATATLNKIGIDNTIYNFEKELPETTSTDAGDVLTVNNNGEWAKAAPSGGGLVIYDAIQYGGAGEFHLGLQNNKTVGDILNDISAGKYVIIKAGGNYYPCTLSGTYLHFSCTQYISVTNLISIATARIKSTQTTANEIYGMDIRFAPPSST